MQFPSTLSLACHDDLLPAVFKELPDWLKIDSINNKLHDFLRSKPLIDSRAFTDWSPTRLYILWPKKTQSLLLYLYDNQLTVGKIN